MFIESLAYELYLRTVSVMLPLVPTSGREIDTYSKLFHVPLNI